MSDPSMDRGVKKLFGAYTEEDEEGERILSEQQLLNMLSDFSVAPELVDDDELSAALAGAGYQGGEEQGISFNTFKKFLRKLSVIEYKKKRYGNKYHTHDQRHNELLRYVGCEDVTYLLERAARGKAQRGDQAELLAPPSPSSSVRSSNSASSRSTTASNRSSRKHRDKDKEKKKKKKREKEREREGGREEERDKEREEGGKERRKREKEREGGREGGREREGEGEREREETIEERIARRQQVTP